VIRRAEPEDIHTLIDLGRAFFEEAGWAARATFDVESFAYTCGALMENGILLVAVENDGQVIGMAAAGVANAWWNRNVLTAQELFWYCDPAHRKGAGSQLMAGLEAVATSLGVQLFSMSAEEGLRSTALTRLYRARGYFPAEKLFWKELSGGAL
jgi:L-amino acid N-acyltransferase YncA